MKKYTILCLAVAVTVYVAITYGEQEETVSQQLETNISSYMDEQQIKTLLKNETDEVVKTLSTSVSEYVNSELKNNTVDIDNLSKNVAEKVKLNLTATPEINLDDITDGIMSMVLQTLSDHDTKYNSLIDSRFNSYETKIQQLQEQLNTVNNSYNTLQQFLSSNTINPTELTVITAEIEQLKSISIILEADMASIVNNLTALSKICDNRYTEYATTVKNLQNQIKQLDEKMTIMFSECKSDITILEQTFDIKLTELGANIYEVLNAIETDYNVDVDILNQKLTQTIIDGDSSLSENIDNTRTEINNIINTLDSDLSDTLVALETKVDRKDTELNNKLDTTNKQTNDKLDLTNKLTNDKLDLTNKQTNDKIESTNKDTNDKIDLNDKNINDKVDSTDNKVDLNNKNINDKVDSTNKQTNDKMDDNDKILNDKIESTNKDTNDKIDLSVLGLSNKIDLTNTELTDRILVLNNYMSNEDAKLLQNIVTLQSTLTAEDSRLSRTIADLSVNTSTNFSNVNNDISDLETNTTVNFTNVNNKLTMLSSKTATDIKSLQDKVNVDLKNTVDRINVDIGSLRSKDTSLSSDIDALQAKDTSLSSDIGALQAKDAAMATELQQCFQSVADGKKLLASALATKGVNAGADESFENLSNKIKIITSNTLTGNIKYTYHSHVAGCSTQCSGTVKKYNTRWHNEHKYYIYDYRCSQCSFATEHHRTEPGDYRCSVVSLTCGKTTSTIEKAEVVFDTKSRSNHSTLDIDEVQRHNERESIIAEQNGE